MHQLIGSCTLAVLAETTRLALNAGIDAALLPACFKGGLADSALLPLGVPRFLQRKFTPPMAHARTMMKDMDNLLELARQTATAVPMAAGAAQHPWRSSVKVTWPARSHIDRP